MKKDSILRTVTGFITYSLFIAATVALLSSCTSAQTAGAGSFQTKVPDDYALTSAKKIVFSFEDTAVIFYSRGFAQGDAVYAEILPPQQEFSDYEKAVLIFAGQKIQLTKKRWGYRVLFAIPPESEPGIINAVLRYTLDGDEIERTMPIKIFDAKFKVFNEPLDLGSFSDKSKPLSAETLAFIESCTKKKSTAFAQMIPDRISGAVSHPRDMHYITSDFYAKRVYLRYKGNGKKKQRLKDAVRPHNGLDLRGEEGAPIYAVLSGHIAYAEPAYYEGNLVIINHGDGIFSYYMHMAAIKVKEGTSVHAGFRIGDVGSTGMVTGAHLHISLLMRGVQADPLSILCLPMRD